MVKSLEEYLKSEQLSNFILVIIGCVFVIAGIILLYLNDTVYKGMAYSFIPFSIFLFIISFPNLLKYKRLRKHMTLYPADVDDLVIREKVIIDKELKIHNKNINFFTGQLLLGMIIVVITLVGPYDDDHTMTGIGIGLAIFSGLLLSFQLLTGFKRKLFRHEITKHLGD